MNKLSRKASIGQRIYTRRHFSERVFATVLGAFAVTHSKVVFAENDFAALNATLADIEAQSGGRLGVAVLNSKSAILAGYRLEERFPMCSTFKVIAVGATLARVDAGIEHLGKRVQIESNEILSYAPITKQHVGKDLSVAELCEAAITLSDNTAANLLLSHLGGPAALTQYARSLGDKMTRLDRIEPDLNEGTPGDPRDTTTPAAMARTVEALTIGAALSVESRDHLIKWLVDCKTGGAKLRSGLPPSWRAGDKTGSGGHGSSNDVAVVWPEGSEPFVISAYLTETTLTDDRLNMAHASIAHAVATNLFR